MASQMSKKPKVKPFSLSSSNYTIPVSVGVQFVADGVFFAELKEEEGYSGFEVRVTPMCTEIVIRAAHTRTFSGLPWCFEVIVSGKLRAQLANSMKIKDGVMISSGQPVKEYIDLAVRHALLRQGVLGIKVKIMLDSPQRQVWSDDASS